MRSAKGQKAMLAQLLAAAEACLCTEGIALGSLLGAQLAHALCHLLRLPGVHLGKGLPAGIMHRSAVSWLAACTPLWCLQQAGSSQGQGTPACHTGSSSC